MWLKPLTVATGSLHSRGTGSLAMIPSLTQTPSPVIYHDCNKHCFFCMYLPNMCPSAALQLAASCSATHVPPARAVVTQPCCNQTRQQYGRAASP
jgi:hypothetical protein